MFKKIKKGIFWILDAIAPKLLYRKVFYSQDGEDALLSSFYERKKGYKGFFVDVGAHHPYRFSNTAYYYKKGWRGINIEPTPNLFNVFLKHRKRDINLNLGIGSGETLTFYIFNEGAINTFDSELARERDGGQNGKYRIVDTKSIQTKRLGDVLDEHLPANTKIDLLTIDVEGLDLQVLKSNNWEKYSPEFIMVECEESLEHLNNDAVYQFLVSKNYNLIGRTKRTSIFHFVQ